MGNTVLAGIGAMARTVARGVRIGTTIRGTRTVTTASGSPVMTIFDRMV